MFLAKLATFVTLLILASNFAEGQEYVSVCSDFALGNCEAEPEECNPTDYQNVLNVETCWAFCNLLSNVCKSWAYHARDRVGVLLANKKLCFRVYFFPFFSF